MSEKQAKPGTVRRTIRLFLWIFVILLVPMAMDQGGVDPETVRWTGRVAAGGTVVLCLYGIFTKLLKTLAFVVLLLIGGVVLVSEGVVKAPRVTEWFSGRESEK